MSPKVDVIEESHLEHNAGNYTGKSKYINSLDDIESAGGRRTREERKKIKQ
jgi:hypothetical protein